MKRNSTVIVLALGLSLAVLIGAGCVPARGFDRQVNAIVSPYQFSIPGWEIKMLINDIRQNGRNGVQAESKTDGTSDYFSSVERISRLKWELSAVSYGFRQGDSVALGNELNKLESARTTLAGQTEQVLAKQIAQAIIDLGIRSPMGKYINVKSTFPPVNFKLETPPFLLVVSPRERIENIRDVLLRQNVNPEDMDDIESQVEKLGMSAVVLPLGGLGATYPTFVTNEADLRFTIDAATEEWLHQYLFFRPLGFRYFLDSIGVRPDYEIAVLNETVAGMVSREIGSLVYDRYYRKEDEGAGRERPPAPGEFDFNREMREIRKAVDDFLARGEVEQAEAFMEAKRQFLASKGYFIRKLNQAYFAFHGAYGDAPTSISPIGAEMRELRKMASSLKDFLDTVSMLTSRKDLQKLLEKAT